MATQFRDLETNKQIIINKLTNKEKTMEKITEKQLAYLMKLGKTEKEIKDLTKAQASQLIVDTIKAQKDTPKAEKPKTESKKDTSTKKETSKKTTTKKATTKTTSKAKGVSDSDLVERLTQAIKIAYNGELKKELAFIQESKIDELAMFIVEYAKKNAKSGGFGLDTKTLLDLSKKFSEQPKKQDKAEFSFNIDFNNNTETKKETKENKTKETKKTTKKASTTTKKAEPKKVAETPKKDTKKAKTNDELFEQLAMSFE